ncbi:MAG: DUF167 domain-containing protein [Isosphaeraceae bacterium]|nr:DUF167 domain-containing protein [Isosphaeraceae bacterium]
MIELEARPAGVIVPVKAQPGARRSGVVGEHAGAVKVAVTVAPERGKANEAIAEVLAEALGCRVSAISLLSGETSRSKRFLVAEMSIEEVRERLLAAIG